MRRSVPIVGGPAHRQQERAPGARPIGCRDGRGIAQADEGAPKAPLVDGPRQDGPIARGSGPDIVTHVEEAYRGRGESRTVERLVRADELADERSARCPHLASQFQGEPPRQLRVVVRDDEPG